MVDTPRQATPQTQPFFAPSSATDLTITQLASGYMVVSWTETANTGIASPLGTDIIGRIIDPMGVAVGGEFLLNLESTTDNEGEADIVALADGGFTVVYSDLGADANILFDTYDFNHVNGKVTHQDGGLVVDGPGGGAMVGGPEAATLDGVNVMVVYENDPNPGDPFLASTSFNANTSVVGATNKFDGGAKHDVFAVDLVAANGKYAVTFDDLLAQNSGTTQASVAFLSSNGKFDLGKFAFDANAGPLGYGPSFPAVAWNAAQNQTVAVHVVDHNLIVTALNGTALAFNNTIWPEGLFIEPSDVNLVALPDGTMIVAISIPTNNTVQFWHLDAAGELLGNVLDLGAGGPVVLVDMIALGDGRVATVWNGNGQSSFQLLDTRDFANSTGVYTPQQWQVGTPIGDNILVDAISEVVHGGWGQDTITTAGQPRSYFGDQGNDTIIVTSGLNGDHFDGGARSIGNGDGDTIDWSTSGAVGLTFDLTNGFATDGKLTEKMISFESLTATNGNDTVYASTGANGSTFKLLDGNDTLNAISFTNVYAGKGNDSVLGGSYVFFDLGDGNDTYTAKDNFVSVAGADGGTGLDTIDLSTVTTNAVYIDMYAGTLTDESSPSFVRDFKGLEIVHLTQGADTIQGDDANNTFYGNGGYDVLKGGGGNDVLVGSKDQGDTLEGEGGDDTLVSFGVMDGFYGGDGNDTIDASAVNHIYFGIDLRTSFYLFGNQGATFSSYGIENVSGTQLGDYFGGSNEINKFWGNGGDDTLSVHPGGSVAGDMFDGGTGIDTVSGYGEDGVGVIANLNTGLLFLAGNGGLTMQLYSVENLTGGGASDTLIGNGFANTLSGLKSSDLLDGGLGNDILDGGDDDDTLIGGAGADQLIGGDGSDLADYSASGGGVSINLTANTATGGHATGDTISGLESVIGTAAADTLIGNTAVNVLDGRGGNDLIEGRAGGDTLSGGAAIDTLSYSNSTGSVFVNLTNLTAAGGDASGDKISGFENLTGSSSADALTGDSGVNVLAGGGSDDVLEGMLGGDRLDGGAGNDMASYGSAVGPVFINLASGVTSGGHAAGDTFVSIEDLQGSKFGDQLTGNAVGNNILGGDGDDILIGSGGDDALNGGVGNDNLTGGVGADSLQGDAGTDTANYSNSSAAVQVNLLTNTHTGGDAAGDFFISIENLYGSGFADTLTGDTNANSIDGGNGDDVIDGGNGGDRVNGGNGFDTLTYANSNAAITISLQTGGGTGGAAQDDYVTSMENITGSFYADKMTGNQLGNILSGGNGADDINGSNGNDTINGGAGNDLLVGGDGADAFDGGADMDTVYYYNSSGAVSVDLDPAFNFGLGGHAQADTYISIENVTGSANADVFTGNGEANVLDGWLGNDNISGGGGADTLIGERGDDTLIGGAGADTINGGIGFDSLEGGGDADIFVYDIANFGHDTIYGFQNGVDRLDVRGIAFSTTFTTTQDGANAVITTNLGYTITLFNFSAALVDDSDFIYV